MCGIVGFTGAAQAAPILLDGLAQRGVKATFFLVGEQVADHQDTVRRMADEGHQIGLHTWHHVSLQGMTREEIAAQLGKTQQTIQAVVGPEELMLRPPYGFVDETLKQWANCLLVGGHRGLEGPECGADCPDRYPAGGGRRHHPDARYF